MSEHPSRGRRLLAALNGALSGAGVALRALRENKLRAALTALGIVIGVTTVTGILSVIHGLDRSVADQLAMMGSRSLYLDRFPWAMVGGRWWRFINRPAITDQQYERIQELCPFAEAVAPMVTQSAKVERGARSAEGVTIRGTNAAFIQVTGFSVAQGRFLSPVDVLHDQPYTVLGAETAEKLFPRESPLGKTIRIQGTRFTVIGVLQSQGSVMGQSQDALAVIPLGRFRRSFGARQSLTIGVQVFEGVGEEFAATELRGLFRRIRALRPSEEDDFEVNHQEAVTQLYHDLTGKLYLVIIVVAAISLVIGGISIMNIMLVSVTERTREIGVRKALGARKRTILFQFMVESLTLSALGGIIGLCAGAVVAYIVDALSPLPARMSPGAVVLGLGFASLIGLCFGIYPAWRAARLDPIAALRYE